MVLNGENFTAGWRYRFVALWLVRSHSPRLARIRDEVIQARLQVLSAVRAIGVVSAVAVRGLYFAVQRMRVSSALALGGLWFIALACWPIPAFAHTHVDLITEATRAVQGWDMQAFGPEARLYLERSRLRLKREFRRAGRFDKAIVAQELKLPNGVLVMGYASHKRAAFRWTIAYSLSSQQIEHVVVARAREPKPPLAEPSGNPPRGKKFKSVTTKSKTAASEPASTIGLQAACVAFADLCVPKDERTVEFLFATTRKLETQKASAVTSKIAYTRQRASHASFGAARVRVPESHHTGRIELPAGYGIWGFSLYEQKQDPSKHFVVMSARNLDFQQWLDIIKSQSTKDALVFVHGYNTSFEAALYRMAQIIWDLQYKGTAILFSWASGGGVLDYLYDQTSALNARGEFASLLRTLRAQGFERINILAHSMGNLLVLETLANEGKTADPIKIHELIMAAPDVDREYFEQMAPEIQKLSGGITLYVSAADKALVVSRSLAQAVRAGDVPAEGPITIPGIDTIDVSALGDEFLGVNHDVFAATRKVVTDIGLLLSASLRPPSSRASEIRGVPLTIPRFWRYFP